MLARNLRAALAAGTALSLAFAASPAAAQLVRSGDLVNAIDSGGNGGQLTIIDTTATQTDMTVLAPVVVANWSRFNVPTATTVNIANGTVNPTATLINRVIGANFSDISGTINAPNVNLWLINQNGILFGSGASVNSASFFASTLDVSDADLFDFYQGTNLAGNGSSNLRFSGSLGNAIATSSPNVSFVTDGTILFVSEQLNLDATFNAGTGNVAFVAASDVNVSFTPGSPLSYVINAGTTVADAMTIGGSVSGGSIDFRMITAAGVVNALLRVDADLNATTALATDTGIRLLADQGGSASVTVEIDGVASTTGRIDLRTDGSLTATSPMTGSGVFAQGSTGLTLDDVTATNGSVQLTTDGNLVASDVQATGNIGFAAANLGSATFGSLISSNGTIGISGGQVPGTITVSGAVQGTSVDLFAVNTVDVGDVTATAGNVSIETINGGILAEDVSATGGNVRLIAPGSMAVTSITAREASGAGGAIDVFSFGGGALDFGALASDGNIALDTDGNVVITGPVTAGGNLRLGEFATPNIVVFNGAVSAQNITVDATSVSVTNLSNLTATAGSITVNSAELIGSALSATDDVIVNATNLVSLASVTADSDGDNTGSALIGQGTTPFNLVISGATTGASAFLRGNTLNVGSVTSTGGDATLSAVSLTAGAVSATGGNANIDAIGGITVGPITANAVGMVGGNASVRSNGGGALNIGAIDADGTVALDTTGSITTAAITAGGALTVGGSAEPSVVTFGGNVSAGSVTVDVTGAFSGQSVTATAGGVDIDAGSIGAGNIAATGGDINLISGANLSLLDVTANSGIVRLTASGNLSAEDVLASGDIRFAASNSGTASFASLISTGGNVFVNGLIPGTLTVSGAVQGGLVNLFAVNDLDLGDVTATAGGAALQALNGTISAGDVSATGGNVVLFAPGAITTTSITAREAGGIGGAIDADSTGGGNLVLGNLGADGAIALDTTGSITTGTINTLGALNVGASRNPTGATFNGSVSANELFARASGLLTFGAVNQINTITGLSTGGALSLENATGNLAIAGLVTAGNNDVTIRNSGDVTISNTGQLVGGLVALSADDRFINLRGSDAITASDRWVVYSAAPAGNTFGGLDSGNTAIWNGTIDTVAPESLSGNRYVFAFQPTLTVTSTDTSKVYGTDLTGALDTFFTVSGLQDGVAGAYLGDTVSGILTGAPSITSAGSVANADVAGGPYVMNIGQGSLAAANGYALTFDSNGRLTITPRDITASVTVNNRTYDGTTAGTGTVTLNGVITGDDVGTTGTTFTFDSRNAGTGRTVTIAGTSLTGADAGNYTLTVPATALADILARAITASVTVNNRTYDGTTAGTGTVTLNGVITGDDVGTTGTTFTFDSRNAGTGRTVTIAGTSLTGADAGNYTLTVPATALADILARVIVITADDQEKTQGTPDPSLTFVIGGDGLVEGDTLSGSLARDPGELVGDYRIGQGSLDAGSNYEIQFEDGTLTITAQPFGQVPLRAQVLPGDIAEVKASSQLDIEVESLCADQEKEVCRTSQ